MTEWVKVVAALALGLSGLLGLSLGGADQGVVLADPGCCKGG